MKGKAVWKRMMAFVLSVAMIMGSTGFSGLCVFADEVVDTEAYLVEEADKDSTAVRDSAVEAAEDAVIEEETSDNEDTFAVGKADGNADSDDALLPDAGNDSAEADTDKLEEDSEDALSAEGDPVDDPEGDPGEDPPIVPDDINISNVTINGISYNFVIDGIDLFGMTDQDSWLVIDPGLSYDDDGRVCGIDTDDHNTACLNTRLSFDAKDTLTAFLAVVSKVNDNTYTLTPATDLVGCEGLEVVSFANCNENECSLLKNEPGFYRLTGNVISNSLNLSCGNVTMQVESGYSRSGWLTDSWLASEGTPASNYISAFLGSHNVNAPFEPGVRSYYFMYRQQDYSGSCYKVCDSNGVSINSTSMPQFYVKNWDEENGEDILIPYGDEDFPDDLFTCTPLEAVNMAGGIYNVFRLDLDDSYEPNRGQIVTFMKNGWLENGEWKYSPNPDYFELNLQCSGGLLYDYLQWVDGEDIITGINRNDQGDPNWEKVLNVDVEHEETVYMAFVDENRATPVVSANDIVITDTDGNPLNDGRVTVTIRDYGIQAGLNEATPGYVTVYATEPGDYLLKYKQTQSSILLHVVEGRIQFFGTYDEDTGELSNPIDIPRDSYAPRSEFYIQIKAKNDEKLEAAGNDAVLFGPGSGDVDPWLIRYDCDDYLANKINAKIVSQNDSEIIIKFFANFKANRGEETGMEIRAHMINLNNNDHYSDGKYIHVMGKVSGLCARVTGDENIMPFKKRIDVLQGDTEIELKMADDTDLPDGELQTWNSWEEEVGGTTELRAEKTNDITIKKQNNGKFLLTAPRGGDFKITIGDEEVFVGVNGIVNYSTDEAYALSDEDDWNDDHCFNPPQSRRIAPGKSFFIRMCGDDYRKVTEVQFSKLVVNGSDISADSNAFKDYVEIKDRSEDAAEGWTVYEVAVNEKLTGEEGNVKLYFDVDMKEEWQSDNPRSVTISNTFVTFTPYPVPEFIFKDWIEWNDGRITGVNPECRPETERFMITDCCDLWLGRLTGIDGNGEPVYEAVTDADKISISAQNDAVSFESLANESAAGDGFWRFRFDQEGEYTIRLANAKNSIKVHVYPRILSLSDSWSGEPTVERDSNVSYDVSDNGKKLTIHIASSPDDELHFLGLNASTFDNDSQMDMSVTEDVFDVDSADWTLKIDEQGTHFYEYNKPLTGACDIEVGLKDSAFAFGNYRVDADIDYEHYTNDEESNHFGFHENYGFHLDHKYLDISDGKEQCGYAGSFIMQDEYDAGDPWLHGHDRAWVHATSVQGVIDALSKLRENPTTMYSTDGTSKKTVPSDMVETTSYILIVVSHNGARPLAEKEYLTLPDWVKGAYFDSGQDYYRTIPDDTYHTLDTSLGAEPVYYEDNIYEVSPAAEAAWPELRTSNHLVSLYDGELYAVSENTTRKDATGYSFYEMGAKLTDTPARELFLKDEQQENVKAGRNGDEVTVERLMIWSFYEWDVDINEDGEVVDLFNTDALYTVDRTQPLDSQELPNKYFTRLMMDPFSFPVLVISADNDLTLHGNYGAQDSGETNPQMFLTRNRGEQISDGNCVRIAVRDENGGLTSVPLVSGNAEKGTYRIDCESIGQEGSNQSYLKLSELKPITTQTAADNAFKQAFSDNNDIAIEVDPEKKTTGDINNLILSVDDWQSGKESGLSDDIADAVMSGDELELKLEANGVDANDANYATDINNINTGIASDVVPEDGTPDPVYMDLKLNAGIKGDNTIARSSITKLRNEMEIVLPIPLSMRGKDLTCLYVLAYHDGQLVISIANVNWGSNTMSFMSDRFSTFAIVGTKESKFEKDNKAVSDALKNAKWTVDENVLEGNDTAALYDGKEHVIGVNAGGNIPDNVTFLVKTTGPKGGIVTKAVEAGTYTAEFVGIRIGDKVYQVGKDFALPANCPLAQNFVLTIDAVDLSKYSLEWTGNWKYTYDGEYITPEITLAVPDSIAKFLSIKYQNDLGAVDPGDYSKVAVVQVKEAYKEGLAKDANGQVKMPQYEEGVLWQIICEHGKTHLINRKPATLTEDGYTGDLVCDICGVIIEKGQAIPKLKPVTVPVDPGYGQPTITPVKVGDPVSDANGSYKVTDTKLKTVTFTGNKDASGSVTIPSTMKIGNESYAVTEIAAGAFKGNTKMNAVTIGDNIRTIGAGAFEGATKLKSVVVGKNVTTIKKNAFKKCSSMKTFKAKGTKITTIEDGAFQNTKKMKSADFSKQKLKKIGKNAFSGSGVTKIKINVKAIKKIVKSAFKDVGGGKKVTVTIYAQDTKAFDSAVTKLKKGKGSSKLSFKYKKIK